MKFLRDLLRPLLAGALLLAVCASASSAADEEKRDAKRPGEAVSYYRDVVPIIREHCQGCHQPAKRGGELLMTSYAGLLKGGESEEPGFVAGKPDESLLVKPQRFVRVDVQHSRDDASAPVHHAGNPCWLSEATDK